MFIEIQKKFHMKVKFILKIIEELEQNYDSVKKENDALKAELEEALKRPEQKTITKSK